MGRKQVKKSYIAREKTGKKKDFLKRAYKGKEFQVEFDVQHNKELLKLTGYYTGESKKFYDTDLTIYTIAYYKDNEFYCNRSLLLDEEPKKDEVFHEIEIYKNEREIIPRNDKAIYKYKKLRDRAYKESKTLNSDKPRKRPRKRYKYYDEDIE